MCTAAVARVRPHPKDPPPPPPPPAPPGGGGWGVAQPRYANHWAPLTNKRPPPHSAQPQHTDHWAPRTRKRHQKEHRPQRPTESSDPTQHAKGRAGDCLGPRNETATRRGGGGRMQNQKVLQTPRCFGVPLAPNHKSVEPPLRFDIPLALYDWAQPFQCLPPPPPPKDWAKSSAKPWAHQKFSGALAPSQFRPKNFFRAFGASKTSAPPEGGGGTGGGPPPLQKEPCPRPLPSSAGLPPSLSMV